MSYQTRSKIKKWITREAGTKDDARLNEMIERMRAYVYAQYERLDSVPHDVRCFKVQDFCANPCDPNSCYRGISLPYGLQTIEAAWYTKPGETIAIMSDWYDYSKSREDHTSTPVLARQVSKSPTYLDITPCGCADYISFLGQSAEDEGKKVNLVLVNESGIEIFEEELTLSHKCPAKTSNKVLKIDRVVLPDDLVGGVMVYQGSRVISNYSPSETVPMYPRYSLEEFNADYINVRASRELVELRSDNDLVEINDINEAIHFAKAINLHDVQKPDQQTINAAEYYQQKGEVGSRANKAREEGKRKAKQLHVPVAKTSRRLNRFNRR